MNHKSISLFNAALLGIATPGGHGKLNSTAVSARILSKGSSVPSKNRSDSDPSFKPRKEKLQFSRQLTGAQFFYEIDYLDSIEKQDVLAWRFSFFKAQQICNWNEDYARDFLLALTGVSLHEIITSANSVQQVLLRLVQIKYPPHLVKNYSRILSQINQNQYHDIDDYLETIDFYLIRRVPSNNASETQYNEKRDTTFIQGLSAETRNFVDIHINRGASNILQLIMFLSSVSKSEIKKYCKNEISRTSINDLQTLKLEVQETEMYLKQPIRADRQNREERSTANITRQTTATLQNVENYWSYGTKTQTSKIRTPLQKPLEQSLK